MSKITTVVSATTVSVCKDTLNIRYFKKVGKAWKETFRVENQWSGVAETLRGDVEGYEVYSVDGYRIGRFADRDELRNLAPGLSS